MSTVVRRQQDPSRIGTRCEHRVETQRILVAVQVGCRRRVRTRRLLLAVQPSPQPGADRERSPHRRPRCRGLHEPGRSSAATRGERPGLPRILGCRYGLSSKELTPAVVMAVLDELGRAASHRRFTIGIRDDVSGSSLAWDPDLDIEPHDASHAVFFGLGSDGTVSANKATIKIIGEHTAGFARGHFEYDSRKSGSTTISYLRLGPRPSA
jgi:pyruvate-ferredoxin/flavodoxin oxidoreductase